MSRKVCQPKTHVLTTELYRERRKEVLQLLLFFLLPPCPSISFL